MRTSSLAALLVLAACSGPGGARYDAATDTTTYRAPATSIGAPSSGGSLGAAQISIGAEATCRGADCAPDRYEITLSKAGGNTAVTDYSQVSFETQEGTISFGDQVNADGTAQFYSVSQGEFVRLSVPSHIYRSLATAPSLTIRLGGSVYTLSYGRRAPLRSILPAADA